MIYLQLFWSFVKIGFTSFGGLSMVPLIRDEMLSHGWMTIDEVTDIVAIAEMTPGPLGYNSATFAGIRTAPTIRAAPGFAARQTTGAAAETPPSFAVNAMPSDR